jgi:hypothetical protein
VDWNSDGLRDIVSGDRYGNFNMFIQGTAGLEAFYRARVLLSGDSINVGYNSQPAVTDWDRDGKKDLLLGCETGYIYLYLNQATDTWPMFQDFSYVNCGGSPIMMNRINPYVFDLNQDGRRDLICGANDGYVHYFENTGSDTNPTFSRHETLKTTTGQLILPSGTYYGSRCGFGDWNNDGWTDFLLSGYDGLVEIYYGTELTGVQAPPAPKTEARLDLRVSPNPVTGTAQIRYVLPRSTTVSLGIYDAAGRLIRELASGMTSAGAHTSQWTPDCPPGVYLCRLTADDRTFTRKLTVTRE